MSEGDPNHPADEPDLEDVEYEALDEIADESRESRPQWSVTVEALKAASDVVAQFDMKDLVSRAERICLDGVGAARDVFADMSPNDTHGTLQQRAWQAASALGTIGRRRARAQFLALHLGFVAVNHHGPTGDSVLGLVSKALEGLGTSADGIEDLARAWSAGERSFFDRMARHHAGEHAQGTDLAEHIVYMSIAQDLRANDAERSWLWENRGEVVELAEELMAGWSPGDAIDIGELYRRADALVQEGHYLPPQVAEVVRLALAALAGDTVPVRHAPDPKTAAVLDNVAQLLERGSAKLRGELQGQSAPATPRGLALRAAEFELREVWTYFRGHLDAQLARASDGPRRAKALGAALGERIGPLLAELSTARRSGTPAEVASKAAAVRDALSGAETALRQILGPLDDLSRMKELAVEADALRLLCDVRDRVAALCREAALGRVPGAGRFDAAILVARLQTARGIGGDAAKLTKPAMIADEIGNAVGRLPAKFRAASWCGDVGNAFTQWADAAKEHRLGDVMRPDPKDASGSNMTRWPGLGEATRALASAVGTARTGAAGLGTAERKRFNACLDEGLMRVSSWLRATVAAKDTTVAGAEPAKLAAIIESQLTPVAVVDDPGQAWKAGKADLVARLPKGVTVDFDQGLREALADWKSSVDAAPRQDDVIVANTWTVLAKLSDYRTAVTAAVTDPDLQAEFGALFDVIGESVAARLATLH